MANYYIKLFGSITDSTIWCESHPTRIMWITLLAMADMEGKIIGSLPGLAHRARVTLEEVEYALRKFQEPDKYSKTPDYEGRRIAEITGGWKLLNYEMYRNLGREESIKESKRQWARRNRSAKKVEKNIYHVEANRSESTHNTDTDTDIKRSGYIQDTLGGSFTALEGSFNNKYIFLKPSNILKPKPPLLTFSGKKNAKRARAAEKDSPEVAAFFENIDPTLVKDFKRLRRGLKAPITATVVLGLTREAKKANLTPSDVLRTCCERGWRGFKASWLLEKPSAKSDPLIPHSGNTQREVEAKLRVQQKIASMFRTTEKDITEK
jgi:hypothetical protein